MKNIPTYEELLNQALQRVPNDVDKREGSLIYTAIAPAIAEIIQAYIELQERFELVFVDTATDEFLDRLVEQYGVKRNQATKAVRKGIFLSQEDLPFNVPMGMKFGIEGLTFIVIGKIKDGEYKLECATPGEVGNKCFGAILPIDYLSNFGQADITDILIPAEDTETNEALKKRFYEKVNNPTFGGNIADYKNKTKEISGVGAVKVIPVWNGGGSVKLIVLDSNFSVATDELIERVQSEIDPKQDQKGIGIAPICHVVTVESAKNAVLNITTMITLQAGFTVEQIKSNINKAIEEYLLELRKGWEDEDGISVRVSHIDNRMLGVAGVIDVNQTKINGQAQNFILDSNVVPTLGEVTINA